MAWSGIFRTVLGSPFWCPQIHHRAPRPFLEQKRGISALNHWQDCRGQVTLMLGRELGRESQGPRDLLQDATSLSSKVKRPSEKGRGPCETKASSAMTEHRCALTETRLSTPARTAGMVSYKAAFGGCLREPQRLRRDWGSLWEGRIRSLAALPSLPGLFPTMGHNKGVLGRQVGGFLQRVPSAPQREEAGDLPDPPGGLETASS